MAGRFGYEIGDYKFVPEEFLPATVCDKIVGARVSDPGLIRRIARARKRRPALTRDGKLTILSVDHPARMVTRVGDNPLAMGDRYELLARVSRVLTDSRFDGFMATADVVEELLVLDYMVQRAGGPSFLGEKVILGCMNRGGLAGASFEMDDTMTGYTARAINDMGLDGAKLMFRLEPGSCESGKTIMYCVNAINELVDLGIPVFLETLAVKYEDGKYKTLKEAEALVKVVGVGTGLGGTTALTWLKIPYCAGYEKVARATTCPILMLGGESTGDPTGILTEFAAGMRAGATVRGALVGRNVSFPGSDDPRAVAVAVSEIVHAGASAEEAVQILMNTRGQGMDDITRYLR